MSLLKICLYLLLAFWSEPKDTSYQLAGELASFEVGEAVVLYQFNPVSQVKVAIASGVMEGDGTFTLEYPYTEPDLFRLEVGSRLQLMLVIDRGQKEVRITADGTKDGAISITGSPDTEKLLGYDRFRAESNQRLIKPAYDAMQAAGKNSDQEAEIVAVEQYAQNSKIHRRELLQYTAENIGTSIALYGTVLRWTGDEAISRLDKLVGDFAVVHPDLKMTRVMQEKVARYRRVAVGAEAPGIVLSDSSGVVVRLADSRGKYVLIDFWASWCGPCLLQVPDLKRAYAGYREKGFEIYSISVDSKAAKWKKAIRQYEMDWIHVSDVEGWQSQAAIDYNVTFLPFNLLIDPEGRIIEKNLHSVALQKRLGELMP